MKLKSKLRYLFFKAFPKKYIKFLNRIYDHKLNYNLINLQKRGIKIDIIFDIGAFRGDWSKFLNSTSLKNKSFYLFEANEENHKYLEKLKYKSFFVSFLIKQKKWIFFLIYQLVTLTLLNKHLFIKIILKK